MSAGLKTFLYRMGMNLMADSTPEDQMLYISKLMNYVNKMEEEGKEGNLMQPAPEEAHLLWEIRNEIYNHGYWREYKYALNNPGATEEEVETYFSDRDRFIASIRPGTILERIDRDSEFMVVSIINAYEGTVYGYEFGDLSQYNKSLIHTNEAGEEYVHYVIDGSDFYNYNITDREVDV